MTPSPTTAELIETLREAMIDADNGQLLHANQITAIEQAIAFLQHQAPEVERLRGALNDVCDTIGYLRRMAEERGSKLDGAQAYALCLDPQFIRSIARKALETETAP